MAAFKTTIHHNNFTAVGRGWNVTIANDRALWHYAALTFDDYEPGDLRFLEKLASEARSARRGGDGECKWRIDRDKSFIIIERV